MLPVSSLAVSSGCPLQFGLYMHVQSIERSMPTQEKKGRFILVEYLYLVNPPLLLELLTSVNLVRGICLGGS